MKLLLKIWIYFNILIFFLSVYAIFANSTNGKMIDSDRNHCLEWGIEAWIFTPAKPLYCGVTTIFLE